MESFFHVWVYLGMHKALNTCDGRSFCQEPTMLVPSVTRACAGSLHIRLLGPVMHTVEDSPLWS